MLTDHHVADDPQVDTAIRCYFLGKLRVATKGMPPAVGMSGPFLPESKLDTNLHNIWERPMNLSIQVLLDEEACLKSMEGGPEEVQIKACSYIALLEAHKMHNLEGGDSGAIWVLGLKGLLYAVKGDYKAAKDFLCHCVIIADQADLGSHFFHEYVVSLFAEALGYLLTHVMDFRVPILDCFDSAPGNCSNGHAIYPFFLQQLGLLQEDGTHIQDIFESLLEFARLNPCWPEASCACFHAYYRAACMAVLDQDVKKARVVLLEGIKDAQMSIAMECSLWKALGEMEFECTNFRQALKDYSVALRCRLAGPEQEAFQSNNISIQLLCERIMELVPLVESTLATGLQGPAADADGADFLAFALCVLSLCETPDKQMILWQQVADLVAVKQQTYPWISHALDQLELGYSHAGAHSSAAEACLVYSRMNMSVLARLRKLSRTLYHWHNAGELGKALEIVEEHMIPTLALLDESDWELHALLQISAASFFDVGGRSNEAFALRQAAVDLVCCRGLSSSEYKLHEGLLPGLVSLLDNYFHRNRWLLADTLVNSFDTQIHEHFSGTAKWKQWQMLKAEIAHVQGEYESAGTILREVIEILEGHTDPEPELQHYLVLLRGIVVQNASNGKWNVVLKKSRQILEECQKLTPCLKIKYIEMRAHILIAMAFNHIAGGKGKAELEIAEAVKLYDTWSLSEELAGDDHNRYARLFAEGLAGVRLMQAHTALTMDSEAEKAWNLTQHG